MAIRGVGSPVLFLFSAIIFLFYSYFFSALFPIFLLFEQPPSLDSLHIPQIYSLWKDHSKTAY